MGLQEPSEFVPGRRVAGELWRLFERGAARTFEPGSGGRAGRGDGGSAGAAVLEEAEAVADGGDVFGGDLGDDERLGAGRRGEHLAERVDDPAVAGVVDPAAGTDPVAGDDVGLVLDRPRLDQRLPVQPAGLGPVSDEQEQRRSRAPAATTRRRSGGRSRRTG